MESPEFKYKVGDVLNYEYKVILNSKLYEVKRVLEIECMVYFMPPNCWYYRCYDRESDKFDDYAVSYVENSKEFMKVEE